MTSIEQLIGDLLLQNNCVIVPSFGGFVAQKVSAKIDFTSGKMIPPNKSLLFNKQLVNNDGLLINELAKKNNISFDLANTQVTLKVDAWNAILANGGRIELDRIGFLYKDTEHNLCFEQDRFFNLLLESFGLGLVHFLTEEDVQINEQRVPVEEEMLIIEPITGETIITNQKEEVIVVEHPAIVKSKTKIWKYVAAACLLPIAFYSFWIPMKTNVLESGIVSFQDFNPFHKKSEASYHEAPSSINFEKIASEEQPFADLVESLPEDVNVYTYKYDDSFFIPVKVKEPLENQTEREIEENASVSSQSMNYIVGCFGEVSNAENLVAKLKAAGLDARIVDVKNGLHRVSAGAALSNEAFAGIKSVANGLGFKGWILK